MIIHRYRIYMLTQLFLILVVTGLFKTIADRQVAGAIAGFLFVLINALIIYNEFRLKTWKKRFSIWASGFFLLFPTLPIWYLRLFNWGQDFSSLSFLGLSGADLHRYSQTVFMMVVISHLVDGVLEKKSTNIPNSTP